MQILTINDMDGHTLTFHPTTTILKKVLEQILKTGDAENHDLLEEQLPKIQTYAQHTGPYKEPPGSRNYSYARQIDADEDKARHQLLQLLHDTQLLNNRGGFVLLTEVHTEWPKHHYQPLT